MLGHRGLVALLPVLLSTLLAPACDAGAGPGPEANLGSVRQAIIGGTLSDDSQDDVVMLVIIDPVKHTRIGVCTATLIAPKLVVTARHCVAPTNEQVGCDADGTPLVGGQVANDFDAGQFFVFTGKNRADFLGDIGVPLDTTKWKPNGQGAKVIDDKSGTLCNHDMALLLLKDPITNVPLGSVRLDGEATVGEPLLTVGWGVASDEVEPKVRRQRSGDVTVERVGPDPTVPVLTKSEFLFGESICLGDSGGPIFDAKTNALIGVVSRGGNGSDPNSGGPASTCTQASNVGTKLAPFKDLILDAFNQAGASPILEPEPAAKSGCAAGSGSPARSGSAWGFAALAATAVALGRRRRQRPRPR